MVRTKLLITYCWVILISKQLITNAKPTPLMTKDYHSLENGSNLQVHVNDMNHKRRHERPYHRR